LLCSYFLFFLLLPFPPCSPLFPYTTLFRSLRILWRGDGWHVTVLVCRCRSSRPGIAVKDVDVTGDIRLAQCLLNPFDQIDAAARSEEHTSELQSRFDLVCRLLLEKKKTRQK